MNIPALGVAWAQCDMDGPSSLWYPILIMSKSASGHIFHCRYLVSGLTQNTENSYLVSGFTKNTENITKLDVKQHELPQPALVPIFASNTLNFAHYFNALAKQSNHPEFIKALQYAVSIFKEIQSNSNRVPDTAYDDVNLKTNIDNDNLSSTEVLNSSVDIDKTILDNNERDNSIQNNNNVEFYDTPFNIPVNNTNFPLRLGTRVQLKGPEYLHNKLVQYAYSTAVVVEVPVHPITWIGIQLHDGQIIKIRKSALYLIGQPISSDSAIMSNRTYRKRTKTLQNFQTTIFPNEFSQSIQFGNGSVPKLSKPRKTLPRVNKLEDSWISRQVFIVSGKLVGHFGRITKSGHGFYSVLVNGYGEVMKRAAEISTKVSQYQDYDQLNTIANKYYNDDDVNNAAMILENFSKFTRSVISIITPKIEVPASNSVIVEQVNILPTIPSPKPNSKSESETTLLPPVSELKPTIFKEINTKKSNENPPISPNNKVASTRPFIEA